MIPLRITALIAAIAVVGAVTPAAFAQNTVTATQSNSFTASVDQSISQTGGVGSTNTASQGFCLQANQQNAAAGNNAANTATNTISASVISSVDCS